MCRRLSFLQTQTVQKTDLYCTPENNSLKRRARATRKHEARTVMAATDVQPDQSANWRRSSLSQGRPIHVGSGVRRLRGACLQDWGRETAFPYTSVAGGVNISHLETTDQAAVNLVTCSRFRLRSACHRSY